MQSVVFSAAWFDRHQRVLLWLLHAPLLGRWFRWVLCIRRHDVGYHGRIVRLLPHAYIIANADGSRTLECRTHAKYAKRLFYAFQPLWWALHAWDQVIANPLVPALNAGFDTLTAYPDPDPETTSVDGWVGRIAASAAFATIRGGAGTNAQDNDANDVIAMLQSTTTLDEYDQLRRGVFLFDTSAVGGGSVSAATFSVVPSATTTNLGTDDVHVCAVAPASNTALATADYGTYSATSFGSLAIGSISLASYNDIALNASGIAAVAVGGVTKFGTRLGWDLSATFAGTWLTSAATRVQADFADQTGTANDPKLVVTFTPQGRNRVTLNQNRISGVNVFTNSASTSLAFSSAVTSGQLLTCCVTLGSSAATVSTITDTVNAAGKWQRATRLAPTGASSRGTEIWYAPNSSAGTPTVTVTLTSTAAGRCLFGIQSWNDASTISTAVLGSFNSTSGNSSLCASPILSSISSGSVVVAVWKTIAGVTNRTSPSGWSTIAPQNSTRENTFYQLYTSSGTSSATWGITTANAYAVSMAEFLGSTFTPVAGATRTRATLPMSGVQ